MSDARRAMRAVLAAAVWALAYAVTAQCAHDGRWADRALAHGAAGCAAGLVALVVLRIGLLCVWPGVVTVSLARWAMRARR